MSRTIEWCGFELDFKPLKKIDHVVRRKPNGSNTYYITLNSSHAENVEMLIASLPPSHPTAILKLIDSQISNFLPLTSPKDISKYIKEKTNRFFGGEIVYIVSYEFTKGYHVYTLRYSDRSVVTLPSEDWDRLKTDLLAPFSQSLPSPQLDASKILDEPEIVSFYISFPANSLVLEMVAKILYIYSAQRNEWLRPYASRIGWSEEFKCVNLPIWSEKDFDFIIGMVEGGYFNSHIVKNSNGIRLSDGERYILKDVQIPHEEGSWDHHDESIVIYKGKKYFVDNLSFDGLSVQEHNELENLIKVSKELVDGLLPFSIPYPTSKLDDGNKRIKVEKDELGIVVSIEPDEYIVANYSEDEDISMLKEKYEKLWNEGVFLTNLGHATYTDSYSPISYECVKLHAINK